MTRTAVVLVFGGILLMMFVFAVLLALLKTSAHEDAQAVKEQREVLKRMKDKQADPAGGGK